MVPQELNLDPFFTPRELLDVQAGIYGVPRRSGGPRQILAAVGPGRQGRRLCPHAVGRHAPPPAGGEGAGAQSPPVLVLDEPTAGVDIQLRQQLWAYVSELNASGVTILLTTHYLEEAEQLCDRIAIIDRGRVVADEETSRRCCAGSTARC